MKFSLTNIGKIAQADIEINGLTVLGGYNDIGKSTIGKVIFSVVKTMSDIEQEIREAITEQVEQELADFSVEIRKMTGQRLSVMKVEDEFSKIPLRYEERHHFYEVLRRIEWHIERFRKESVFILRKSMDSVDSVSDYLSEMRKELKRLGRLGDKHGDKYIGSGIVVTPEDGLVMEKINSLLNSLENNIKKICSLEKTESYKKVFNSINRSLFRGDIQNRKASTIESKISLADDSCQIDAILESDNTKLFSINGDFPFRDVTLVDSPLVLGWSSAVGVSRSRVRNVFGHYIFDLLNKMRLSIADSYNAVSDLQQELVSKIGVVIGGQMYYDRQQGDFIFKQSEMNVKLVNLASGIKTFGIIQMLLTGGTIAADTVLIIDEPEAHLHPEWQLKYAEVITQLVEIGVYVLVSTHSPYMIEALKHYSEKLQQEKITNFYLGNAGKHGTVFSDVTQNLNPLFKLLSMPMQRLAFED